MKPDALNTFSHRGTGVYNESKATEFLWLFYRAYRVSFLYISSNLMLGIYQDVLPYTYRKLYKHTIPCDLIIRSISDRMAKFSEQTGDIKRHHLAVWEGEVNSILDGASPVKLFPAEHSLFDQEDMVFRDALTGMYDRIFGLSALNMYISRGVIPISIVLGDINGLSRVNEKRGYEAGDDMLVCVAHTIRRQCRAEDVIARWGNDEFLILLPYTTGEETQKVIKRLQEALIGQCTDAGHNFITFGYASADHEPRSATALIHEAEKWVYRKKLLVRKLPKRDNSALHSTLHENSPDTQEHSDRLTQLCREIAMRLKLSSEETNDLVLLSLLHDIGKIGIRQEILNKPGPLTPTERLEIELHPEIGFRIAQNIPELAQVARYILAHHEHWDGKGYPNGLHGEEIPLASRIVLLWMLLS
jgi:diguanylate cyclase (GGDEF)-like protein